MRAAPTYPLYTWRLTSQGESALCYRPSLRTVVRRLGITLACFVIAGLIGWGLRGLDHGLSESARPASGVDAQRELQAMEQELLESMRGALGEEAAQRIVREADANRERRSRQAALETARFEEVREILLRVRNGIVGLFVFLGIYAPLSCLWNRVTISRTPQGELRIRSFLIFPRAATWSIDEFYAIRTFAMESYGFCRRGGLTYHRWEWLVQLSIKGRPNLPFLGSTGLAFGDMSPQFNIHHDKHQPSLPGRAPEAVRDLVKGLRAVTGLKAEPPQLLEGRIAGRRRVAYNATLREVEDSPVAQEKHVFRHGEHVPDHIQARIAAMTGDRVEALPDGGLRSVTQQIVVEENGRKVVYNSIDDLPEHIRRRLGL